MGTGTTLTRKQFCPKCSGTPGGIFKKANWMGGMAYLCETCAAEVEQQAVTDQAEKKCCGGDCAKCKNNPAHIR